MLLLLLDYLSNPPTLFAFIENVASVIPAKWRCFGIALELTTNKLNGIGDRYRESQDCYEAIFQEWKNSQLQLRWERIVDVLRTKTVNENSLADELSQRVRQ